MLKILEEEKADHAAVAFDLKEPTFRHEMYDAYKGTRKPMPQELHEQVPVMKDVLKAMGIPIMTLKGFEADDILGTVAKRCQAQGIQVSVVSGDRDLLQLADEHIKIRIPRTSRGVTEIKDYFPADVLQEYQVTPEEFIDVKALMGGCLRQYTGGAFHRGEDSNQYHRPVQIHRERLCPSGGD